MSSLSPQSSKRIAWIDNLRGLSCILVLVSHSNPPTPVLRFISPFFLCLFFFLSGFLFKERPVKNSLKNIFNRLVIPYFFAAIASCLITYFGKGETAVNIKFIKEIIASFVLGRTLWFIPCLITIEIIYSFIIKIKINRIFLAAPFAATIFFTNNHLIFNGLWGGVSSLVLHNIFHPWQWSEG